MAIVLAEQLSTSKLNFINESVNDGSGRKYLGRLKGICAECDVPTRNGRVYSRKLWEKVIGSDTFKEYLDSKCLYGELNHPEERLETDIKEVAIALSDIEITPEGPVNATFDILDTPNGRILKSLCEYGSKLGVSSRGGGDVLNRGGESVVDEDSYEFVAFDVVCLPAVKKARPSVVESVEYKGKVKSLTESIETEIANITTKAELESVKRILENIEMPNKDSIIESIGNKMATLAGEADSATLLEDLNKSIEQSSILEKEKAELLEKVSAGTTREMALREDVKKTKSAMRTITEKFDKANALLARANKALSESNNQVQALTQQNEKAERRITMLSEKLQSAKANARLTEEFEKQADMLVESSDRIRMLTSDLKEAKQLVSKLQNANTVLESEKKDSSISASRTTKQLTEAVATNNKLQKANNELVEAYILVKCTERGLDRKLVIESCKGVKTLAEINNILEQMSDYKLRVGSLPLELGSRVSVKTNIVTESTRKRSTNPDDDNLESASKLLNSIK